MEIFFTLMAHRQNGDRFVVLYLDERHIACSPKWNNELAQERIGVIRLSASERHHLSEFVGLGYRGSRTDCCFKIVAGKKIKQPLQVFLCGLRYAEPETH